MLLNRKIKGFFWLPLVLLVISLACSLPTLGKPTATPPPPTAVPTATSRPTPTPQPLPPAVVENDPPVGSELPLSGPITLYFNQPMDRASVEASFRQQLGMSGTFTWVDDLTLVFYPDAPLEPAADFKISLTEDVRAVNGLGLLQPVSFDYRTVDYLRPLQMLPRRGAQDIDPTSAVVVAFNYPVVPLGAEQAGLPAAFELEPSADGRGEWLNTSTYIFYPQSALVSGRQYTVRLNPDLRGTDGSPLENLAEWSFSTSEPRLESVDPGPAAGSLHLDPELKLTFNQPMDPDSVKANLRLLGPGGEAVPGSLKWDEKNTSVTFKPTALLARDTDYSLTLDSAAQAAGGTALGTDLQLAYRTVPALAVIRTDPPSGGVIDPQNLPTPVKMTPYGSLALYLTSPLKDYKDQTEHIRVEPAVTNLSTWWDGYEGALRVSGDFLPEKEYTITILSDLADVWGGTLGQDYTVGLRVGPMDPNIYIAVFSPVLFQPANDPVLSVQASNLAKVPTTIGQISLQDYFTLRGPDGYNLIQNYRPANAQTWEQMINAPSDRAVQVDLDLSPDGQPLLPGLYFLKLTVPRDQSSEMRTMLVSSNVQLALKVSPTDTLVWAVDLRDGSPVADAPLTIYAADGTVLAAGQTDSQGVFQAEISPKQDLYSTFFAVLGQPGEDRFGLVESNWTNGLDAWEQGIWANYILPGMKMYWYSDRPVYRPGDTVHFRGVARQVGNGRYTLPDLSSLPVIVTNDYGQTAATYDLPLSTYGTIQGEYAIPPDARPGYYNVAIPDQSLDSLSFQVAEYRKPEINLQVNFTQEQLNLGSALEAEVSARYFFDAPASNIKLHWYLNTNRSDFYLPGYQVGPVDTGWLDPYPLSHGFYGGEFIMEGEAETQPDGTVKIAIPAGDYKPDPANRRSYILEVTATDEGGLPVSARDSVVVNPDEYYIGIRSDSWSGQSEQPLGFDVQVVDWQKQSAGARELQAEFSKVVWKIQENTSPNPLYTPPPTYVPEYTLVDSTSGVTNEQGQARLSFTPPEAGVYQLAVTGGNARTEVLVWVSGSGQVAWPSLPNKRLLLVADRTGYKPGDTASVFIPNPFGVSASALLGVERGKVLRYQLLTIEPGGSKVSLPLTGEDAPNVYLSLTMLAPNEQGLPDFRQGYLNLDVDPTELVLKVELASSPQRAGPGDQVTFDVRVTDADGNPVQGEFSLAVVDLAALALADPNSQDIVPAFYSRQPLGVKTALDLSAYTRLFSQIPGGIGGGGGGDGAAPQVVRDYFPDTAYWNASLVTDADGTATVSLTLPDTLTTWHADVRGLTQDTRVGQASAEVVTTKDLLVRPVTPRFLVAGDHVQLAAIVQNNTSLPREVSVAVQATGLTLDDPALAAQQVTVPANSRSRVEWWGTAQDVPSVDLVFSAETIAGEPALQDAARPPLGLLPVLHYNARQAFRTAGILDDGGERLELVSLPKSFDSAGGQLSVELSPSLAAAMMRALDALEHFPYECTEQTVSRFLPNLETYTILQDYGLGTPALQARLDRTLAEGISRLQNRQNPDGGWGWWSTDDSDSYLTAYVLYALYHARQAGVTVNDSTLSLATDYLSGQLAFVPSVEAGWELDRLAFQHMVLAEIGVGQIGPLDALYERRSELNPWAQASLALAYERLTPGSDQARTLLSDLEAGALRSASGAYWPLNDPSPQNMVGPLTNSAMVLYALAKSDPGSPLVADAVRFLMSSRQPDGAWNSTYATAWTLMALNEVVKGTGELGGEFAYAVQLNGSPLAEGQAGGADRLSPVTATASLDTLYPDDPNALLFQRQPGTGRLYYTAGLEVARPVESAPALSQGLSIERSYLPSKADCPAGDCAPIESAQAGHKVTVRLTLTVPNDAYHLVVEDYLPAGSEILDTSLKTSQQSTEEGPVAEQYDPSQPYSDGWGWWYFDNPQVYDDHIAWAASYLPAGTYQFTYTLVILQPGEYRVLPARAWQFYFPDVQANTSGAIFEIKP